MKKAILLFLLLLCSGTIYCQVKSAGWQYSYEKKFKVREGWGGYESSNGPYYSKSFVGEAECMASANLLENKKTSNNIYEWIRYRIVKGCSCNSSLPTTKKKPAMTEPNKSVSQPVKSGPKLNPNDAGLMHGMSEAIYNSQQSSIDEKNRRNEQNANRYAGGRPSSEQSYNLPILNGSSNSETNQPTNENKKGEVLEYDSDDDGIVDTRRTELQGQEPVYEKIENTRPSAIENNNLEDLGSDASTLAEVAESLGSDTYSSIGNVGGTLSDLKDLKALKDFYDNPKDSRAAIDATNTVGSRIASALSSLSGMMYDKWIAPIPDLQNDVMNSSLENASSLLKNGTYDEKEIWRSVGNYFGNGIGMGNVGDRAKDFSTEGDKSWSQLKSDYGFYEGTKKAVWYYLLNDLKENSTP